jgi:hypothetical protein
MSFAGSDHRRIAGTQAGADDLGIARHVRHLAAAAGAHFKVPDRSAEPIG